MFRSVIVNIARLVVGLTLVFSGFVKAVDPLGTVYKLQDYAEATGLAGIFPEWLLIMAAVALSLFEFALGVSVLFAIGRKTASRLTLAFMAVMTLLMATPPGIQSGGSTRRVNQKRPGFRKRKREYMLHRHHTSAHSDLYSPASVRPRSLHSR